ncbi:nuclear transport factor 2 family protein [Nocardia sp. NPDC001965]
MSNHISGSPHDVGTIEHALWLVERHIQEENPSQIEQAMRLYTDDIIWEVPGRRLKYQGKEEVKANYLRIFDAAEDISFEPIERFATPERVIDDMRVRFKLIGPGFENAPVPFGSEVEMRLVHNFHITDGLISREIGYEMWLTNS